MVAAVGQAESAGEVALLPGPRQFQKRQRVAVALGDDLVDDRGVDGSVDVAQQQHAGVGVAQPVHRQLGQPGQDFHLLAGAGGAHQGDRLGQQAPGDEGEDLGRGLVEPLPVVDQTGQGLLVGGVGQHRERGEPDEERVGRRTGGHAQCGGERVALWGGQPVQVLVDQWRQQLMQAAVGQVGLGLHAGCRQDTPVRQLVAQVAQQGALAGAGVASQHQHLACCHRQRRSLMRPSAAHSLSRPSRLMEPASPKSRGGRGGLAGPGGGVIAP